MSFLFMVGLLAGILYMESEYPAAAAAAARTAPIATSVVSTPRDLRGFTVFASLTTVFTSDCSEGSRQVQLGRG